MMTPGSSAAPETSTAPGSATARGSAATPENATASATDYEKAIAAVRQAAQAEIDSGIVRGLSVALVDGQDIIYTDGFGMADPHTNRPATSKTVYRCGSISKLFNGVAVMQLVEQGKLDLDAPITDFDPEFSINVPFREAVPITLRQLLCHRSGMIRESPVGNYFDETEPGIRATVRSVAHAVLVNPPNTKTNYSNVGPTIAGHLVALQSGMTFEDYQRKNLLDPMGMNDSSWVLTDKVRQNLAVAGMGMAQPDGSFEENDAPVFDLGTLPAGNLYTTAEDLSRFMIAVLNEGQVDGTRILSQCTLNEMFTVQLIDDAEGFGLSFRVAKIGDHRSVSHNGAVYGFSSAFMALPDLDIGVIVLVSNDVSTGPQDRVLRAALSAMVEAKTGKKPFEEPTPRTVHIDELKRMEGEYESQSYWANLKVADGRLIATVSGQMMDVTPVSPSGFVMNGKRANNSKVEFTPGESQRDDVLKMLNQDFHRVDPDNVQPIPEPWKKFLGSYGPKYIPLVISQRNGHLYAMTENIFDYRLTPVTDTVFAMPPGLYTDEYLVIQLGRDGEPYGVIMANIPLGRNE